MNSLSEQINDSLLQPEEKEILISFCSLLSEDEQLHLSSLFANKPQLVPILYLNLISKNLAARSGDQQTFTTIIDQEITLLEELAKEISQ